MSHALREAFNGFARAPVLILVSILAVALSLFVFGIFGLTAHNVRLALTAIEERVELVAYLRDSATPEQIRLAEQELKTLPEVQELRFVSKTQAMAAAVQELPEFRELFSAAEVNPLPASFEISLRPGYRTPGAVENLAQHVLTYPFVEDAEFGREWVAKISSLQRTAAGATAMIGGAFAMVAGIIIGTAVRIAVGARREEIEIMRLVGATDAFIRAPFLAEGLLVGLIGGFLALLLTFAAYQFVSATFLRIAWLPGSWLLAALAFATLFGLAASGVAVRRHLRAG